MLLKIIQLKCTPNSPFIFRLLLSFCVSFGWPVQPSQCVWSGIDRPATCVWIRCPYQHSLHPSATSSWHQLYYFDVFLKDLLFQWSKFPWSPQIHKSLAFAFCQSLRHPFFMFWEKALEISTKHGMGILELDSLFQHCYSFTTHILNLVLFGSFYCFEWF